MANGDNKNPTGESWGDWANRKSAEADTERAGRLTTRSGARAAEQEYELVADKARQGKSPNWLWNYAQSGGFNDGAKSPNVMIDTDQPRQFATEESRGVKQPMVVVNDGTQRQYSQDPRYAKMREVPVYRDVTLRDAQERMRQQHGGSGVPYTARYDEPIPQSQYDYQPESMPEIRRDRGASIASIAGRSAAGGVGAWDPPVQSEPEEQPHPFIPRSSGFKALQNAHGSNALGQTLMEQQNSGVSAGEAIAAENSRNHQKFLNILGDREAQTDGRPMSEEREAGFNIGRAIGGIIKRGK